jgi:hypothetical protein
MSMKDRAREGFSKLPPGMRRQVLHRLGRYAPWEPGFDFTPPPLGPGEVSGPPDFVGIGVQKAGTTWWYRLLSIHPDIASPVDIHKERHFLDRFGSQPFGPQEIDRYHGWFPRPKGALTGEWTPDYFAYPWAPPLLKQAAPDTRLLLLLRDPLERFQSGLAHHRRMGSPDSPASIADAVDRGFYNRCLEEWLAWFPREQMLVLQYERCAIDPVNQLNATFRFLDLPELHPTALEKPRDTPPEARVTLDQDVKNRLVSIYESDVVALATRLPDLDLTLWPNFTHLVGAQPSSGGEMNSPTPRT